MAGARWRWAAVSPPSVTLLALTLLALGSLCGCASAPKGQVYDPLEKVNRATHALNRGIDKVALTPLARVYETVTPKPARRMIYRFFDNAHYPNTVLNDFLQGKGRQGLADLGRFVVNSTLGIAGLFDPASYLGLVHHEEDFGQTLGVWGFGPGAYVELPVYGPETVRDMPDLAVSTVTSAAFWLGWFAGPQVSIPLSILYAADRRSNASGALRFINESALDPYVFLRDAWLQHRTYLIYDGNPPGADEFDDEDFGDE